MPRNHIMRAVRRDWDADHLRDELLHTEWIDIGRGVSERAIFIGRYDGAKKLAEEATPQKEWSKAVDESREDEIVVEYLDAVADWVGIGTVDEVQFLTNAYDVYLAQRKKLSVPGVLDWMPPEEGA